MVSKLVQILLFARIAVGQSLPHRFPQRVRSLYANLHGSNLVVDSTYIGGSQSSGEYFQLSGTSMSAPMVVGSAASMIEQAGFLAPGQAISPDTIKGRLMKTATKLPLVNYQITIADTSTIYNLQHDIFTADAGSLDVLKALGNTDIFSTRTIRIEPDSLSRYHHETLPSWLRHWDFGNQWSMGRQRRMERRDFRRL